MLKNQILNIAFASMLAITLLIGQVFVAPQAMPVVHAQTTPLIDFPNMTLLSPNGQKVVYVTAQNLNMVGSTIWVANTDLSQAAPVVTGDSAGDTYWVTSPLWSPDGQQIAYMKVIKTNVTSFFDHRYEIWTMNSDGSNNRLLVDALFSPSTGYGGKTDDFSWGSTASEIKFSNLSTFPPTKYIINTNTLVVSQVATEDVLPAPYSANIPDVTQYLQTTSPWAQDYINNDPSHCATLFDKGSALTASAMVLNYLFPAPADPINPGDVNLAMLNVGGFQGFYNYCYIIWASLSIPYSTATIDASSLWRPSNVSESSWKTQLLPKLQSRVSEGVPVILWYYLTSDQSQYAPKNFVTVTGYNGSNIYVYDPKINGTTTLNFFATGTQTLQGLLVITGDSHFSKASPEKGAIDIAPENITLSWDVFEPTPESYRYCVNPDWEISCGDPNNTDWTNVGLNTQVTLTLDANTTYTWQVQAVTSDDIPKETVSANFVKAWKFTTGDAQFVTISGIISGNNTEIGDVTITYTNGGNTATTLTASNGSYSFSVPPSSFGSITPSKTCYNFSPASLSYNTTSEATNRNFLNTIKTFDVTGDLGNYYTNQSNFAEIGVFPATTLNYILDGNQGVGVVGSYGKYKISNVQCGQDVTIMPSSASLTFSPVSVPSSNDLQEDPHLDFRSSVKIQGQVTGLATNAGLALNYTNSATSNLSIQPGAQGYYGFGVLFGSSGTITPNQTCSNFAPTDPVTYLAKSPLTINFARTVQTFNISGNVNIGPNVYPGTGISQVRYTINGAGQTPIINVGGSGDYTISNLECGANVKVTPSLPGITFDPLSQSYTPLLANQNSQDYMPQVLITGNAGHMGSTVMTYTANGVTKTPKSGLLGNYSLAVPYNWTGTVTPSLNGVEFSPPSTTYTSLTANQITNYDGVFTSLAADDGYLVESGVGTGVGVAAYNTGNTFRVGDDASNRSLRSMLSFDTSALPDTAVIQSATLKIKFSSASTSIDFFDPNIFKDLRIDIKQGTFGTQALEISDFNAPFTVGRISIFNPNPDSSNWYNAIFDQTAINANINKSGMTQFRLRFVTATNNNAIADYMMFIAGDYAGGSHPQLVIDYTVP